MSLLRDALRTSIEQLPTVAASYRRIRHVWQLRFATRRSTPFGTALIAPGHIAVEDFERDELTFLQSRLRTTDVFVDVGANVGFYTCFAASRCAHVLAIEPLAENLEYLYENITGNDCDNVEVFPVGLAGSSGLRQLFGGATGASLVAGWANTSRSFRTTIPVTTLDNLLHDRFTHERLVIKVDVEGAEIEVLDGAAQVLSRPRLAWMLEICLNENRALSINPSFERVFDTFWSRGYQAHTIDRTCRLVTPDDIRRWCAIGRQTFGSHNYWFERPVT